MSECLKCKYCGRLEPLPRGDPSRLQSGQWGMLARGLVYCSLVLAVIASVESVKVKNKTRSFRFQGEVFWLTFFFAMVFFIYSGDLLL